MSESLEENYARAGYHTGQQWGRRPALLLVDFARAYYEPDSPLYGGEGCITARDNAARLLDTARQTGTPAIFTEVRYAPGGADGGVFFRKAPALKVMEAGNPLGDLRAQRAHVLAGGLRAGVAGGGGVGVLRCEGRPG